MDRLTLAVLISLCVASTVYCGVAAWRASGEITGTIAPNHR
jgi:hypothetical protein